MLEQGHGTSYEALTLIPANEKFTRIGRGVQNGERWDKVLLDNGMLGYVFQNYVQEVPPPEEIYLDNEYIQLIQGKSMKLNARVIPENATNKNLVWSSDNESIATVDENGIITAISEGETIINVKVVNENVSAKCNVKVIQIEDGVYFELDESLKLNGDEISRY